MKILSAEDWYHDQLRKQNGKTMSHFELAEKYSKYLLEEQDKNKYSERDFKQIVCNIVGELACANNMTFNGAILDELFNKFKKK